MAAFQVELEALMERYPCVMEGLKRGVEGCEEKDLCEECANVNTDLPCYIRGWALVFSVENIDYQGYIGVLHPVGQPSYTTDGLLLRAANM